MEGNTIWNGIGEAAFFNSCSHSFLVVQPNVAEDSLPLAGVFFKRNSKCFWV